MKNNQKRSDVDKVAPHMIIEKYKHTEMRYKYENSLLQKNFSNTNNPYFISQEV